LDVQHPINILLGIQSLWDKNSQCRNTFSAQLWNYLGDLWMKGFSGMNN
jgi:hypothetical protein